MATPAATKWGNVRAGGRLPVAIRPGAGLAAFLGVLDGMTLADLLDPAARSGAAARLGMTEPQAAPCPADWPTRAAAATDWRPSGPRLPRMTPYDLAVIGSGMIMGLWLDRLLGPRRGSAFLMLGASVLAVLLLLGQDWAGMALGGLFGARLAPARAPKA